MRTTSKIFAIIFLILAVAGIWVFAFTAWLGRARFDYLILSAVILWLSWILKQDSNKRP
jgi:glucose dehydrogenase